MEQKVIIYMDEYSQRQTHLRESRVKMTLNLVGRWGVEESERGTRCSSQEAKGIKKKVSNQNVLII